MSPHLNKNDSHSIHDPTMHDSHFAPEQSKPSQGLALKAFFITTLVALLIAILLMYFIDHLSRRHFWVRRRLERFCDSECEHWGNEFPLGRSDAFSFLFPLPRLSYHVNRVKEEIVGYPSGCRGGEGGLSWWDVP
ncbi:hypothetical protein K456DRAFT_50216 [Colletotrichum gloeosporioides 23]|nr:hypothetical protein K456DRAFT_50216 [Colletotrichum gloeosporioides 23]